MSQSRLKALNYYNTEAYGDEVDGSSQIVTSEVRDTIESAMPSLMKIFMSGDKVAQFDPTGPEDEEIADQATDYANYIFTKDNDGFGILQTAFRDGFIQKVGVVKIFWEETLDSKRESYQGLSDQEFEALLAPDEVEAVEHTEYQGQMGQIDPMSGLLTMVPVRLHDVVCRRTKKSGRARIVNIPPEEFLIARRAVTLETSTFTAHRVRKTASQLIEEGYDRKLVDGLPGYDAQDYNQERIERFRAEDEAPYISKPNLDPSMKEVWLTECYLPMDYDGDGIAELRKVTVAGDPAVKLLDNEEIESLPFRAWTPIPQPHKFYGLSLADLTMDLQLTQSTVVRQMLNNMYQANNNRHIVSNQVNLEDMLTPRPGGIVRMVSGSSALPEGHVMPLPPIGIGEIAMPLLEFLDAKQETRTGITKYNQGLDANTLNKTASGINIISGYAQQRQELMARNAAEMLVAGIFKSILELVCKHQQEPRIIRLRNKWVPMDPREWNDQMDVTVTVGLGSGNKDQQLGHLMMILQTQQAALQQLGPGNPLVNLENVYNTLEKICENAGLKTADPYFSDPKNAPPGQGQPPPPPDPRAIAAQGTAQAHLMRAQQEPQARLMDAAIDAKAQIQKARIAAAADIAVAAIKAGGDIDQTIHWAMADIFSEAMGHEQEMRTAMLQPQPQQPAPPASPMNGSQPPQGNA
ncbi:MAG TPA: hypothetical protein VKB42_02800 [Dongiaceae bacterium]|nr:hypothetical protein [Dongiaceae bacterium]